MKKDFAVTQLYEQLIKQFGNKLVAEACKATASLLKMLKGIDSDISKAKVLVAYGGGKDSSYTLAVARFMQVHILINYGVTFQLRVVTNRHAGMPQSVMRNIDRVYKALYIPGDQSVETFLIDGNEIVSFNVQLPLPNSVKRINRDDILMSGHRCYADARPTFCNACNLSMLKAFALAIRYEDGVDIVITGDSKSELTAYKRWIRKTAKQLGIDADKANAYEEVCSINEIYFKDIHADSQPDLLSARRMPEAVFPRKPHFFSIFDYTSYDAGAHWDLLVGFLGFEFDEAGLAFSFTESDCANPALMCHLRGLKAEKLYGRTYDEGIDEYIRMATALMRDKAFPPHLIEQMLQRYNGPVKRLEMRQRVAKYAQDAFGLSERNLICMIYSPFCGNGTNLERYLAAEEPTMLTQLDTIRTLIFGHQNLIEEANIVLINQLQEISGLSYAQIKTLSRQLLMAPYIKDAFNKQLDRTQSSQSPMAILLKSDPHKKEMKTRHSPNGPELIEVISGR